MKQKVVVILGQTSTGKSDFAVSLAKKINGEILSADSRQVYRGLNLGTGKITKKEMKGVRHHMLDIISPKKVYSVSEYKKDAEVLIDKILSKQKVPIICGGTGYYIDSILQNHDFPTVAPNLPLRKKLEKKSIADLYKLLSKIDKNRAKSIDKNNKVRLVRAIEIAKSLGKVPRLKKSKSKYQYVLIGLRLDDELLKKRIKDRLIKRIKSGMINEVKKLHQKGLSWKRMYELGLEYRHVSLYLRGKLGKEEMIEKLNTEIWHYAKRQNTWFKRNQNITWLDPRQTSSIKKALKLIT